MSGAKQDDAKGGLGYPGSLTGVEHQVLGTFTETLSSSSGLELGLQKSF